jgi:hypothetical protein
VCNLLSLILYPKLVYLTSITLTAEYWGSGRHRLSKWFYDTSIGTATIVARCGSLLEMV